MNYPQGSLWRKWDLHIHTPCSIEQNYGGDTDEAWENFILDLERLPPEFKVIGINDYLFIDGYRKVLRYKENNRLQNIDLILPVIEFRLKMFGGVNESAWSRVNFHVIFSDELDPDIIEDQFLNSFAPQYVLSPDYEKFGWRTRPTKISIADLGNKIIDSVPEDKKEEFGSPLKEGFRALNYELKTIQDNLNNSYLQGKYFTAIGKTEWENTKWTDHSIAEKKNIINSVDFIFTATDSLVQFEKSKKKLTENLVNDLLLDCSDAHDYSSSQIKDKIGNCLTWIKSDTTFEGLRQIKYERDRIFIGDVPDKNKEISLNPKRFIKSIQIRKKNDSLLSEKWFSTQLELNPSMIAIIGNKGAGKSALIDIIGLLGNSYVDMDHRPFLNSSKFGMKDKWSHFEATIKWFTDEEITKSLNDDIDSLINEFVRYIPQNFFETICNELQDNNERGLFTEELYKVIFSHIPINDRLGEPTLQSLIERKTSAVNNAIEDYQSDLRKTNAIILDLETAITPERIQTLQQQIKEKESSLQALQKNKPNDVKKPEINQETQSVVLELEELGESRQEKKTQISILGAQLSLLKSQDSDLRNLRQRIESFSEQYNGLIDQLNEQYSEIITTHNIDLEKVISLKVSSGELDKILSTILEEIEKKESEQSELNTQLTELEAEEVKLREELADEEKKYHKFLESLSAWNEKINEIKGDLLTPDTLLYLKDELEKTQFTIPSQLEQARKDRNQLVEKIYDKKIHLVSEQKALYHPIHKFISQQDLGDELSLQFSVSLIIRKFEETFFSFINRGVAGTYYGIEDSEKILTKTISKYDLNRKEDLFLFLDEILNSLCEDRRDGQESTNRQIVRQLKQDKTIQDFYNFIFSLDYLIPEYIPKLGEKELYQLSPGEKGTLLLIFYLLVDKERIPLLIDQPEHNLDNETIYKLLVKSVKIAKHNRQLIVVTHNPNLAVVCDAEQIIYASRDGKDGNRIDYKSGAIECKEINKKIIDVLEGTIPAFNKRRFKYLLNINVEQNAQND